MGPKHQHHHGHRCCGTTICAWRAWASHHSDTRWISAWDTASWTCPIANLSSGFLKPAESSRYAVALLVLIPKRLHRLCDNFVLGNTDPHRSLVPSDHRPQDRHEPLKACGLSRNPHCSSCKGWRFSSEDPHWGCISFSLEEGARYLGDRNRTVKSTGKRTRYESTDSQPSLRIRDCVERVDINACACVCACVLIVHCISCLGIEAVQVVGLNK